MPDDADYASDSHSALLHHLTTRATAQLAAQAGRESARYCRECSEEIPEKRRAALPGVTLCYSCACEGEAFW